MECEACGKDIREKTNYIKYHYKTGEELFVCNECRRRSALHEFIKTFAHLIFNGFCNHYASLRISQRESISTVTRRVLTYFDNLGSMLGFNISTEVTLGTLLEDTCPEGMKGKKVDMVWLDDDTIALHLEYENEVPVGLGSVREEVEKLIASGALLSILYCYPLNKEELVKLAKDEMAKKYDKFSENLFLLVLDPWVDRYSFGAGLVEAVLIQWRGEEVERWKAHVSKDPNTGVRLLQILD